MRRALCVLLTLVGLSVLVSACDASFSPWAARVNGASISRDALDATLNGVAANPAYLCLTGTQPIHGAGGTASFDSQLSANLLTVLVESKAFDAEVARLGLHAGPAADAIAASEIATTLTPPAGSTCTTPGGSTFAGFDSTFRAALRGLYADQATVAAHLAGTDLTPGSVAAYAAKHPNQTRLACVSVVVAKSLGTANSAEQKLSGGASFASVARTYSTDSSATNGGSLGCLQPTALPAIAATVVEQLSVGTVSPPVPYSGQYLLLLVTARKAETSTQVATAIVQSKLAAAQALLAHVLGKARIEIDPAYGAWTKTATGYAVTASSGPSSAQLFNVAALTPPSGGVGAG